MTLTPFEEWCQGIIDPFEGHEIEFSEEIHEREYHVSKVLPADDLKARWEKMNYKPKNIQLKLL